MKLLNFIIVKFTICLIIGIVIAHYFNLHLSSGIYASIGLLILVGLYWLRIRQEINRSPFFAILVYGCMISLGINAYTIQNEKLQAKHYTNLNYNALPQSITFKITERLKPDSYNHKYMASVVTVNNETVIGKILINIKKDSFLNALPIDAIVFCNTEFKAIQKPLNPYQFDYGKYLELKQVYHQIYLNSKTLFISSNKPTTIYGYADKLRAKINNNLIKAGFKADVLSIINALILGQRQNIDKSIYNNYVNAGSIHILAVSGLHVGILLLILNALFSPLLYLKHGHTLRPLLIVTLLWLFAIIAGLSPSVTRAVTMFSIISVAMHLKRPTNIYNTLAISAFFILIFKPRFLFEVGFQMSYLAVIGIISFQPIIYKLWQPKYWIIDQPWKIFSVTLAAQIGVVPISLFYFHQFPGLFFISNLVVIPFLGFILGFGLLIIVMALAGVLTGSIVTFYSFIIDTLNGFIAWVAQFEDFLFRDIPFTWHQVICSYGVCMALFQWCKQKNFKWMAVSLIGVIGFQSTLFYNKYSTKNNAFVVFNKSRFTMIGHKQNDKLIIHHNLDSTKQASDNIIKNYSVNEGINTIKTDSLRPIYQFNNHIILAIDSLGIYQNLSFKPNYILIRNSPKINLNRLIDSLQPQHIIADASNYKTYVNRWKATCIKRKIPFHYTYEKGAYSLE